LFSFLSCRVRPIPAQARRPGLEELESRIALSSTAHLSFGPTAFQVAGYTAVGVAAFDAILGYGWASITGLSAVQRSSGPDPLHQKFIQGASDGSASTFLINLDPGTYKFTFHLGDQQQDHSGVRLSVDGTVIEQSVSTTAGHFFDQTDTVQVMGTQSALSIQAPAGSTFALDGLDIVPFLNVSVTAPTNLAVGVPGTFGLSVTGGTDADYYFYFDFKDGSPVQYNDVQAPNFSMNYAYAVNGSFHPFLQVTDSEGDFETFFVSENVTGTSTFLVAPFGDDVNNDGSTDRPWASVAGVMNHAHFGPDDKIYFQSGYQYQGPLILTGSQLGGTSDHPIVISSSPGGRALFTSAGTSDTIDINNAGNVRIEHMDMVGAYTSSTPPPDVTQSGIAFQNTSGTVLSSISIDDINAAGYAGVGIQVFADHNSGYRDVAITNTTLDTNYGSGLYVWSISGQTYQFQNVLIDHVQVYDNVGIPGARFPAYPVYVQNVQGGVIQHCYIFGNDLTTVNTTGGGFGIQVAKSRHVLVQYNECDYNYTNGSDDDGGGIDFDGGVQESIMQYNYSHDNDGAGFLISGGQADAAPNSHNTIRYNISQNDSQRNAYGGIVLTFGPVDNLEVYNNTLYTGPNYRGLHDAAFAIQDDCIASHIHVRNNVFVTYGGVPVVRVVDVGPDIVFTGNVLNSGNDPVIILWGHDPDYNIFSYVGLDGPNGIRSVVPDFEMVGGTSVAVLADPMLVAIGTGGTIGTSGTLADGLGCYRMQPGSPAHGHGVNLASFGITWDPYGFANDPFLRGSFINTPTDFFGNAYGQRTSWSIGVDQGQT
jgi:hypothetical protein